VLTLFDGEQHLVVTAVENMPQNLIGEQLPLGHGLNGRAAATRHVQQVTDYARYDDRVQVVHDQPLVSVVVVPLLWHDRLVGTIGINDRRQRVFDEDDLHTLTLFGTLAAAAIEQAAR
jgi:GAF domain-containing protein